jgi:G3E family GTPase
MWTKAGRFLGITPGATWWSAVPQEHWPDDPTWRETLQQHWNPDYRDRRQEIVFMGIHMDQSAIMQALDAALLTDDELALDWEGWRSLPDPFGWL